MGDIMDERNYQLEIKELSDAMNEAIADGMSDTFIQGFANAIEYIEREREREVNRYEFI